MILHMVFGAPLKVAVVKLWEISRLYSVMCVGDGMQGLGDEISAKMI
jgi:hypothetical protein